MPYGSALKDHASSATAPSSTRRTGGRRWGAPRRGPPWRDSGELAAALDAPDRLEAAIADHVQVVVQVDGGVAVAGDELHDGADRGQVVAGQPAVLVAHRGVAEPAALDLGSAVAVLGDRLL